MPQVRRPSPKMVAQVVFYLLAALTVGSSMMVAFSRNIVYSTFALLGAFMGVVGIYVLLAADFVAMVQLLVYVGGILVLTIFAVMLTSGIADVTVSNREVGVDSVAGNRRDPRRCDAVCCRSIRHGRWRRRPQMSSTPTTYAIGNAFLGEYVLPFEVASLVLLAALVGAIVISRQETRGIGEQGSIAMGGGITLYHFLVVELIIFSLGMYMRADAPQRDRHPDGRRVDPELRPTSTTSRSRTTVAIATTARFSRFS